MDITPPPLAGKPGPNPASQAQHTRTIAVIVGIIAIAVIAGIALWPRTTDPAPTATVTVTVTAAPNDGTANQAPAPPTTVPPNVTADLAGLVANPTADPAAPVLMVFEDYQCPGCRAFEIQFGDTVKEYVAAGKIRLEYRTMTFLDNNLRNDASSRAANGAACADVFGVLPGYHDLVFANQPEREGDGYSDELLRQTIPAQLGLSGDNLASFQRCYDNRELADFVIYANYTAIQMGVTGTPTYVLGNQALSLDGNDPTSLRQALTAAGL